MKLLDFASLLARRPDEAYGRLEGIFDSRFERFWIRSCAYRADEFDRVLENLERVLGMDVRSYLDSPGLCEIQQIVQGRVSKLPGAAPFSRINNGDYVLARMCYALCRATRPGQVLETGVCYGVTTAFILKALEENQIGRLHSIDLPPLGRCADAFVGFLVPDSLRTRWQLHRGATRKVLPNILSQIGSAEFFVHDSLHTYRNMVRELRTVSPKLSARAIVISDDIDGNPAFQEWASAVRPEYWAAIEERAKSSLVGVGVLKRPIHAYVTHD